MNIFQVQVLCLFQAGVACLKSLHAFACTNDCTQAKISPQCLYGSAMIRLDADRDYFEPILLAYTYIYLLFFSSNLVNYAWKSLDRTLTISEYYYVSSSNVWTERWGCTRSDSHAYQRHIHPNRKLTLITEPSGPQTNQNPIPKRDSVSLSKSDKCVDCELGVLIVSPMCRCLWRSKSGGRGGIVWSTTSPRIIQRKKSRSKLCSLKASGSKLRAINSKFSLPEFGTV